MTINDIKEAMNKGDVYFGLKQTLKNSKKIKSVFVAKDTRDEVLKTLDDKKILYKALKTKKEMAKLLDIDFIPEVYSIR